MNHVVDSIFRSCENVLYLFRFSPLRRRLSSIKSFLSSIKSFLSTSLQNSFFWPILSFFLRKKKEQNFQNLTKNHHGLTPLEKWKSFDFLKSTFLQSIMASFLSTRPQNTFFWCILLKQKKRRKFPIFDQ